MKLVKLRMFKYKTGVSVWMIDESGIVSVPSGKPFHEKHKGPHRYADHQCDTSASITMSLAQAILDSHENFSYEKTPGGCEYYWTDTIPVYCHRQFFDFLKIEIEIKEDNRRSYYDLKNA